jgi:molybdopterin-containing oxidoreductase family iron-sulfur binding subunit
VANEVRTEPPGDLTSIAEVTRDLFRPDDAPEQSYSERQIFEAASSRLARELGAMEQTDEKAALAKILDELRGPLPTAYPPLSYQQQEYRWAMAIDLNLCTGCSACVVACQSENNIPVVGKANVAKSREMHWLRIDRYFEGPVEEPQVITQPLACVHCEFAPCEYVCPVHATVHSDDGLNEMVYNRCVGTRYCSNNCPYKVRRFNFFDWNDRVDANHGSFELQKNPDVTVRERGVMEKCSYCVQRIREADIAEQVRREPGRPQQLQTACQQACPTGAIVFGSLTAPDSKVAALQADPLCYGVLEDQGTRPRTRYLVKLVNANPEMT